MQKMTVVAYFQVSHWNGIHKIKKTKNEGHDSGSYSQNSNLVPLKYTSKALTFSLTSLLRFYCTWRVSLSTHVSLLCKNHYTMQAADSSETCLCTKFHGVTFQTIIILQCLALQVFLVQQTTQITVLIINFPTFISGVAADDVGVLHLYVRNCGTLNITCAWS